MLGQPVSMLIPQVVGFKLTGKLPEGATATDLVLTVTRDAAQEGRRRQVRRVLRPGRLAACRWPIAPRSPTWRPSTARRAAIFPIDARDAALPAPHRPPEGADRPGRGLRQGAGPLARRGRRGADATPTRSNSTSATSSPRSRAPSARRTASRCTAQGRLSRRAGRPGRRRRRGAVAHGHDEAIAETFPASDPPANGAPGHEPDPHEPIHAPAVAAGTVIAERSDTAVAVSMTEGLQDRPRPRRHRGDHQLHQHLQPVGDAWRRPARAATRWPAACGRQAVGQDSRWRRARRWSPSTSIAPA